MYDFEFVFDWLWRIFFYVMKGNRFNLFIENYVCKWFKNVFINEIVNKNEIKLY